MARSLKKGPFVHSKLDKKVQNIIFNKKESESSLNNYVDRIGRPMFKDLEQQQLWLNSPLSDYNKANMNVVSGFNNISEQWNQKLQMMPNLVNKLVGKLPKIKDSDVHKLYQQGGDTNGYYESVSSNQWGGQFQEGGGMYMDGADIPNYMQDPNPLYNFGGYFPQGPRFQEGGQNGQFIPYPYMNQFTPNISEMNEGGGIHIKPSKKGTLSRELNDIPLKELTLIPLTSHA